MLTGKGGAGGCRGMPDAFFLRARIGTRYQRGGPRGPVAVPRCARASVSVPSALHPLSAIFHPRLLCFVVGQPRARPTDDRRQSDKRLQRDSGVLPPSARNADEIALARAPAAPTADR